MKSESSRLPHSVTPEAGLVCEENTLSEWETLKHVAPEDIPASANLLSANALETYVNALQEPPLSLIVAGDIMLGGRTKAVIAEHGPDYPFDAVRPLLRHAHIVVGNLEGPFASKARKESRNYSYRVNPKLATSLGRAGISAVTLANNHLLDCGREGVIETLEVLRIAGIASLGAGINERSAHAPRIMQAGPYRVGLLGYYWNQRTAATAELPGSAMDTPQMLEADIRALRGRVDRIVVTFHWGVTYEREPSADDRAKARFAVDCGADAVVGHHPHIIQPFEIYRGCPIFFSVGNLTFGSGNSRAEGLLLGLQFEATRTAVYLYPLYVKNRDPRVAYQPKALTGDSAERVLYRLAKISTPNDGFLDIEAGRGKIVLPYAHTVGEIN